jgi:hypothetical protein
MTRAFFAAAGGRMDGGKWKLCRRRNKLKADQKKRREEKRMRMRNEDEWKDE